MKQCPYCNAQNDDKSKFCSECGKELPQENVCAYCGVTVNEEDVYCEECGRNLKDGSYASSDYGKKLNFDYKKILISSLIGIVIGLIVLTIVGGSWHGCNEYSAYKAKKEAREKFVADSLAKARKDSIRLAEQKKKERIEAERVAKFHEKLSFDNFLGMLKNYDKESYANKCGLSFLYKNITQEVYGEDIEYFYGYEVEGHKYSWGYDIEPKSKHSCYFQYRLITSPYAIIVFKDKKDAQLFFNKAKEYGLIKHENNYYIPNKKLSQIITIDEFDNSLYEKVIGKIGEPYSSYDNYWYFIRIDLDF